MTQTNFGSFWLQSPLFWSGMSTLVEITVTHLHVH
jgi:hypothetical protein